MKKFFLATILILGYCTSNFSQFDNCFPNNRTLKTKFNSINITDSINFKNVFTDSASIFKITYPEISISSKELVRKRQDANKIIKKPLQYSYNMPIVQPRDSFFMPIYIPDSTIKYAMLIKED